uniref:BRCT domain-containing protein n=1 Tax=Periophthalmus magnuspinnatus TaxID=409849 RepID=A0A3B4BFR2_9GOBI
KTNPVTVINMDDNVIWDVVAYVDVWSSDKTANYSKPFVQQLQEMGAQVTKTFTKQVTHVIFSHGHPATWRRAKKSHVKLVSVLWVGRCYDEAMQVNEDSFPALNETNPVLKNKKHRCMQPKDSPERTPDNDKRIRRKLDKMIKDLPPIEPLEEGTSLPNIKDHRHESLRTETTQPWMSPCSQVQSVNVHISPVKYPNFEENEDEEEKKRQKSSRRASRRVSVKKNSTESPKCILSDSKKSGKKVSRRSTIKSPSSASKELKTLSSESISKKGQELTKRNKSYTETKIPENVKCTVTTSAAATNLSIKTTSPKEHTESKLTPIFSALVRLPTVPCESRKTVPCSTDGDDDVFEDYFSPAYLRQKPKKASFSGLSAKTFQLPFELDSDSKKRKPRSESAVNETSTGKKKKLEQSTLHLKDLDTEDASERLSHKEGNKLLSDLASSSDNLKQLTKKKRQSALQFTSICAAQTTRDKQLPLSARKTKSEESPATLELHKKPDGSLKSSVTSE